MEWLCIQGPILCLHTACLNMLITSPAIRFMKKKSIKANVMLVFSNALSVGFVPLIVVQWSLFF